MAAGFTVVADRSVCIGSGTCVMYAPGTFDQDGEAKVVVLDPITDAIETARVAVDGCPTRALQLIENPGQ